MAEWTNRVGGTENQRKKQNIPREVKKENTQNLFFERLIFYAFAFKQDSDNVFCLSDYMFLFLFILPHN